MPDTTTAPAHWPPVRAGSGSPPRAEWLPDARGAAAGIPDQASHSGGIRERRRNNVLRVPGKPPHHRVAPLGAKECLLSSKSISIANERDRGNCRRRCGCEGVFGAPSYSPTSRRVTEVTSPCGAHHDFEPVGWFGVWRLHAARRTWRRHLRIGGLDNRERHLEFGPGAGACAGRRDAAAMHLRESPDKREAYTEPAVRPVQRTGQLGEYLED